MNPQYIKINMVPNGVVPVLYCSQYDVGRPLGMVVYNGSETVDLDDYTVTLEATRTDGTAITAAITTDGNVCALETTATMTNRADRYPAQIVVADGNGKRIASIPIKCVVIPAAMDEDAEGVEEDRSLYQQYTGTVQSLIADIRTQLNAETAARQAADNQLQSNINAEASARATQDNVLQAEIDQLVAPSGSAPSAAEVTNARIGADGTTYDTLGNAIRGQVTDVKSAIDLYRPAVTTVYSDSSYGTATPSNYYYRLLNTAPISGKTYIVKLTVASAGNHTFQIGVGGSTGSMRDTIGTFTMGAGESRYVYGYVPNGNGYTYCRNSAGDDWDITLYEISADMPSDVAYAKGVSEIVDGSGVLVDGVTLAQDTSIGPSGATFSTPGQVLWFPHIVYNAGTKLSVSDKSKYRMYIRMWDGVIDSAHHTAVAWTSDSYTLLADCYVGVCIAYKPGVSGSLTVAEVLAAFSVSLTENAQKGTHEQIAINAANIKKNSDEISNLSDAIVSVGGKSYVKGINHRGYNTEAPQNTIPAFVISRKKGFDYVETDVRYTSDGIPVLLHDFEINYVARNADGSELTETINIADITYEQALQYVFCGAFYSEYPTQRITTFRDFMSLCRNLGLHPYIELKSSAYDASVLVDIVRECGMLENVTWISFGNYLLDMVKTADANARLGLLVTDVTETAIAQAQALKTTTNDVFISASSDSAANVALCKTAGIPMEVYTLNSAASIISANPYVSGITSDTLNASAVLYDAAMGG